MILPINSVDGGLLIVNEYEIVEDNNGETGDVC